MRSSPPSVTDLVVRRGWRRRCHPQCRVDVGLSSPSTSLLLLVFCVGAMMTPTTGTAGRSATVAAVVADADEAAATVAAATAGRTAAAGVDVTDLGVLAAAGVGGDVATRRGC